MKATFITLIFSFVFNVMLSQTPFLLRQTFSSAGSSSNISLDNKMFYVQESIGQLSAIGTHSSNKNQIRQGFIQSESMSIKNSQSQNIEVNVFPNPFQDILFVAPDSALETEVEITITDLTGKEILKTHFYESSSRIELNMSSIPSGSYIIRIRQGEYTSNKKLIKS